MSYALSVAISARAAVNRLELEAQEAVFDLLDKLADEGSGLSNGPQRHFLVVSTTSAVTVTELQLFINHAAREVGLTRVFAWIV
jgi:hypothetical protein